MVKTKYNTEYQFIDNHKVVDPVDVATHQDCITLDGSVAVVTLDLSISNYFIIDLDGSTGTTIVLDNISDCQRFEILLLEPIGVVDIVWDDRIIFHEDYNNESYSELFEMSPNMRRQMLITFKQINTTSNSHFFGIPTCWAESPILTCLIVFVIKDTIGNILQDVTVVLTGGGYTSETIDSSTGVIIFYRSRNISYNYTATVGLNSVSGTIQSNETSQGILEKEVTINI